jgi:ligand-binding SRPBCC domain-containing protein
MFRLKESIHVNAPVERCFLLSTSVDLVREILGLTPVEGRTTGLIVARDRVVWRGWKFGMPAMHETLISRYVAPTFFQDTMGRGRFQEFQHDHHFEEIDGHTHMYDVVRLSLPLGGLGKLVARYIVVPHVLKLMSRRFAILKRIAESGDWERYVQDAPAASLEAARLPAASAAPR